MSVTQAVFIVLLLLGILAVVGGLAWARLNWRTDVAPYGRRTRFLDVAAHPERYAKGHALPVIRLLMLVGAVLLAAALAVLAYEALTELIG